MRKTIIFSCHKPSINTLNLSKFCIKGINDYSENINLRILNPYDIKSEIILNCNGLIIGTTENIGYMSGLTKDMFDRCYNDWLGYSDGLPVCFYIRAGLDGTATKKSLESITKSLNWKIVQPPLILKGEYKNIFEKRVYELGASFSAGIENNIF